MYVCRKIFASLIIQPSKPIAKPKKSNLVDRFMKILGILKLRAINLQFEERNNSSAEVAPAIAYCEISPHIN